MRTERVALGALYVVALVFFGGAAATAATVSTFDALHLATAAGGASLLALAGLVTLAFAEAERSDAATEVR